MQVFSVKLRLKKLFKYYFVESHAATPPPPPRSKLRSCEASPSPFPSSSSSRPNNRAKKGEEHPPHSHPPSPLPPSPPLSSQTNARTMWMEVEGWSSSSSQSVCGSWQCVSLFPLLAKIFIGTGSAPPEERRPFPLSLSSLPLPPPLQFMSSLSHSLPLLRPRAGRYGIRRNSNKKYHDSWRTMISHIRARKIDKMV